MPARIARDAALRGHEFDERDKLTGEAPPEEAAPGFAKPARLGEELARLEREAGRVPIDDDTIVVPVPDTSKAAVEVAKAAEINGIAAGRKAPFDSVRVVAQKLEIEHWNCSAIR